MLRPGESQAVAAGANALGLSLYHRTTHADTEANTAVSGWAAAASLAKLGAGAGAGTADELAGALGTGLTWDRLHPAQHALTGALSASPLRTSAQAWGQVGYGYLGSYLGVLEQHYGVTREVLDFAAAAESARPAIEAACHEALAAGAGALPTSPAPGEDTRLVLADTLALEAGWPTPFDPALTRDDWFELLNGDRVWVPTMETRGV
ncbi:MAG: serpin family protein, partial [Deferrisomatales bacterium]